MQKNASGGQGLFVFYGREPKRPPFGRRGGAFVCRLPRQGGTFAPRSFVPALRSAGRCLRPALLRTRAFVRQGGTFAPRSFVPVPPFGGEEGARGAADADFVI